MTDALRPLLADLTHTNLSLAFYTAPSTAPPSINDESTSALSTTETLPDLLQFLSKREAQEFSAFLVACYSAHPMTEALRAHVSGPVLNIFQASVLHAKMLGQPFGIVTTGSYWEPALSKATKEFLLGPNSVESQEIGGFVGVRSTGLNAVQLHSTPQEEVHKRISRSTAELVERGARVILMGCAGMSGMEEAVRVGAGALGVSVSVIDGVRAGVVLLDGIVRAQKS